MKTNMITMTPTYSLYEVEKMVDALGECELSILFQVVEDEKCRYSREDLEKVYGTMMCRLENLKVDHLVRYCR